MWKLLLLLLSPRIDEEEVEAEVTEEAEEVAEETEEEAETEEVEETEETEEPAPRISRAQREIINTRVRAQKAEEELGRARAELEAARRAPTQQQPTQDQLVWQQEEEVLRNPEATDWQRYAVQANRSARAAEQNSRGALQRAEDLADRSSFERIAQDKPKLFAAYKDRVEDRLKEIRASGNMSHIPREKILAALVGDDLLNGKLKTADVKTTKPSGAKRVTPGARSDVRANGSGMTEQEKRAKRLENVRI